MCGFPKVTNYPVNNLDENDYSNELKDSIQKYDENNKINEDKSYTIFTIFSKIVIVYAFYRIATLFM
jgi:hypothetical protein